MNQLNYLISSLPEIDPFENNSVLEVDSILNHILSNAGEENRNEIELIVVQNDLRNLVIHFENKRKSYTGNAMPYEPCLMEYDLISEYLEYVDLWPDFLVEVLENTENIAERSEPELISLLWNAYYDELEKQRPFLKEIMQNYIIMHNLLGLIRSKNLDLPLWNHWIGFESQLEDIKSGRLTLSGLAYEHENFNNLKIKTLDTEPEEAEHWCDKLLIDKSAELLGIDIFDIDHLLHYTFKLMIAAKWKENNSKLGRQRIDELKEILTKEIQIPRVK